MFQSKTKWNSFFVNKQFKIPLYLAYPRTKLVMGTLLAVIWRFLVAGLLEDQWLHVGAYNSPLVRRRLPTLSLLPCLNLMSCTICMSSNTKDLNLVCMGIEGTGSYSCIAGITTSTRCGIPPPFVLLPVPPHQLFSVCLVSSLNLNQFCSSCYATLSCYLEKPIVEIFSFG
jgi:hypothetical protein